MPDAKTKTKKAPAKKSPAKKPAPKQTAKPSPVATPVRVDNRSRRSDEDALEGHFVDVIAGEHDGIRGAFLSVDTYDKQTGYPATILVRNRDLNGDVDVVTVKYSDVRPARGYSGGR